MDEASKSIISNSRMITFTLLSIARWRASILMPAARIRIIGVSYEASTSASVWALENTAERRMKDLLKFFCVGLPPLVRLTNFPSMFLFEADMSMLISGKLTRA